MSSSDDEKYKPCLFDVKVKNEIVENNSDYEEKYRNVYNGIKQETQEDFKQNEDIKQEVFEFVEFESHLMVQDEDDPLFGENVTQKIDNRKQSRIPQTPVNEYIGPGLSSATVYQKVNGLFHCPYCEKSWKSKESLKRHLVKHDNSILPFPCTNCENQSFKTKVELQNHMAKEHNLKNYKCAQCLEVFMTKYRLNMHVKDNHLDKDAELYECPICWIYFEASAALTQHITRTHTKNPVCLICSIEFQDRSDLIKHMKTHEKEPDDPILDPSDDVRMRKCKICRQIFETRSSLVFHMKKIHYIYYQCAHCNRKYISFKSLKIHILNHKTDRHLYTCETCNKTYHFQNSLENHKKRGICRKNPCECPICGRIFMNPEYRRKHERVIHQVGRKKNANGRPPKEPVICPHCGKSFVSKYTLNLHVLLHGDAKNFKCEFCDKAFKTHNSLRYHYGNFHFKSISDNNTPTCSICKRKFNNKYTLNMHLIYKHKMPIEGSSGSSQ